MVITTFTDWTGRQRNERSSFFTHWINTVHHVSSVFLWLYFSTLFMKKSKAHFPVEPRKLELPILTAWRERYQESDHGWSKRIERLTPESGDVIYTTNPESVIIGILLHFVRTPLSSNIIAKSLFMAHTQGPDSQRTHSRQESLHSWGMVSEASLTANRHSLIHV